MTAALLAWTLKASLILLGGFAVTALMKNASAAARHFVWTLSLAGVLVLPALGLVLPAWQVRGVPVTFAPPAAAGGTAERRNGGSVELESSAPSSAVQLQFNAEKRNEPTPAGGEPFDIKPTWPAIDWVALAPLIWVLGAGLVLLRLAAGLIGLWTLGRRAEMMTDGRWLQVAHAIAHRLRLGRGVTLLKGDSGTVPMTWGVLQPVVWLPADAEEWDDERRSLVLTHELAHVRRRDALTQWIAHLALVVNWFNPLAWIAVKRFRDERERACDDAVLELGAKPTNYADHLLDIVRSHGAANGPMPALAMARRSQFEGRLLAILDGASTRRGLTARSASAAGLLALATVLPIAAISGEPTGAEGFVPNVPMFSVDSVSETRDEGRETRETADTGVRSPLGSLDPRPSTSERARDTVLKALKSGASDSTLRLVIAAAASMTNDADKSDILRTVLRHPKLDAGDVIAVLEATHTMSSDGDRRDVLHAAIPKVDFGLERSRTAYFKSVSKFTSDGDRKDVLMAAFTGLPIRDAAVRKSWIDAVAPITSDGDKADLLVAIVSRTRLDPSMVGAIIASTGSMSSDGDKARVLTTLARSHKLDDAAQAAYVKQVGTMSSDGDRRLALAALLPGGEDIGVAGSGNGQGAGRGNGTGVPVAQESSIRSATTARQEVVNGTRNWTTDFYLDGKHDGEPNFSIAIKARSALISADGRRFAGLERGGTLDIEETLFPNSENPGVEKATTRTLRVRSGRSGEVTYDLRVDGDQRAWDAAAKQWLDKFVARWAAGQTR